MNRFEFYDNLRKYKESDPDSLTHYGTIGQKWGVRRWQNADGTFNEAGKERYFGSSKKKSSSEDDEKKNEKINKKVERQVKNKLREIKWYNKSPFSKKIDISEDSLKKYYQAYYDLPWYKRTTKNINNAYLKRFSENVDENTQKGIKKIDDKRNMMLLNQHMQQVNQINEINRINNEMNQINQMNMINQINQMNMINQMSMMPGFMGKSSKLKNRYQYENGCLSEEYIEKAQKLANEGKWDELEKLKKKVDFDEVQEWAKKANPDLYKKSELGDPSEYEGDYESYVEDNWEIAAKKRGFDPDNLTNEQSKIIDKDMKDYFNKNEGSDQKIGSSPKEAKKLAKEAEKLEEEFTTTSKYDKNHKYLDGSKIDKWLDEDERNKEVEKAYADAMNTAYGETSKELHKLFKDYNEHNDDYIAKAGICNALEDSNKLGDISSIAYWFLADDGNQGSRNSYAYYLNEKGYDRDKINTKLTEAENAMNEGYEVGRKISQYYNPVIPHMSEDLQNEVYNRIHSRYKKQDDYVFNKLLNASEGLDFDKNNMKAADNIKNKLAPSCGNQKEYGWYYFDNAVRNLGMTDMNYKDLSQSDWDKINAEINKLKK